MRSFLLAGLAITAFVTTMTFNTTDANAVVCAKGVVRAGCAGPNGAVVAGPNGAAAVRAPVARPVVYCKTIGVPKGCVMR
jgi:hypothetical protein